jgi:hypothetical protein
MDGLGASLARVGGGGALRVYESASSAHLGMLRSEFFLVVGLWCFTGDFGKNGSQNVVFLW